MSVTAQAVKELREKSGAGMLDCKNALVETNGNISEAMDLLRKKGMATADKKAGRTAAEGLIAIATASDNKSAAAIELNSETDFVAKNAEFQAAAENIANIALAKSDGNIENVKPAECNTQKIPVSEIVTNLVAKIGENIQLRRTVKLSSPNGVVTTYLHNKATDNTGKIGVLVALEGADEAKLQEVGKQIAMHIAAAKPEALTRAEVPNENLDKEREIFTAQAKAEGKPDNIIEKMVEGRINKYYGEIVLPEQVFVIDGKAKVQDFLKANGDIKITGFELFILGDGIEKKQEDFAAEVAAVAKG
ncbi:MAG: elongation factor Ts [Alphaproteobacteria bacterium CG11_big_fil_rev_8_21_14_0_20_44_7]|nr:MAG: elongation factor Ts [Alphaproteobacteria bacterium CG11_big_fil_rev_8_21_14_0_20_44_7]